MTRIGYASGFLGDDKDALARLLANDSDVDYVGMDYLAEFNLPILRQQLAKDPSMGYVAKFVRMLDDVMETLLAEDITIVTNAGGLNPVGCRDAIVENARARDADVSVAAVSGDNVLEDLDALRETTSLDNVDTGAPFDRIADEVTSANVYLGAFPIVEALEANADVVVTGRCTDTALVLGPLIHEFDWDERDYDRLAAGTLAGHLLECGPQVTGGLLLEDWASIDFNEMGYPVAEVDASGDFVVTKPPDTGGTVTEATVAEQMVYEIGDPRAYLQPDVTTDFTSPTVEGVGEDRVAVTGTRGGPPPETYKGLLFYKNGYKAQSMLGYSWPDALEKARRAGEVIRRRIERDDAIDVREVRADYLGHNGAHGPMAPEPADPNEIILRMAVRVDDPDDVRPFWDHVLSVILGGPPNVFPIDDRPPKPEQIMSVWPCEVPRDPIEPRTSVAKTGET